MQAGRAAVDVLVNSMNINAPEKGGFVQNLFRRRNAWESRPGFGQLCQLDTTLGLPPSGSAEYGYENCLGCKEILTDFGHLQVVSVWSGLAMTGNNADRGTWMVALFVVIYDVTTGRWYEEVIHRKTAEFNKDAMPMPYWRGVYETNRTETLENFVAGTGREFWFHEHGDTLLMGSPDAGLWAYEPTDFAKNRRKQVDGVNNRQWGDPYSESAVIVQVAPNDGVFSTAFSYLKTDTFPSPDDACSFGDRVVYISGNEVFFTDFGRPGSVMGRNILYLPSDERLVSCESVNDHLIFCTPNETWMYQPSLGTTVTQGRLVQLDGNTGCLSPRMPVRVGGLLYWMDRRGAYVTDGASPPVEISGPLQPLFDTSMSNPLYHYFAELGWSDLATDQPRSFYDLLDIRGAHATYESSNELVLFTFPKIALTLVYHPPEKSWAIWNYESFANGDAPVEVEARRGMLSPHLCAKDGRLFMVAGPEVYTTSDAISPEVNAKPRSLQVLEWGRGGGLDRSVDIHEDNREGHGYYAGLVSSGNQGIVYFDEPISRNFDLNEKLNRQTAPPTNYVLIPVYLNPNAAIGVGIDGIRIHIQFDHTQWVPVFIDGVSAELDFLLPPERWASKSGWGYGLPAANRRVVCTDSFGAADRTGLQIRMEFDGPSSGGGWSHANVLNLLPGKRNPLMFLPMAKINANSDVTSFGFTVVAAEDRSDGSVYNNTDVFAFRRMDPGTRHDNDDVAQAVDWAYMAPEIRSEGTGVRLRGLETRIISHGGAASVVENGWIYGLLNAVVGSDWKAWSSQLIDYAGLGSGLPNIDELRSKTSIRSRFMNSASPSRLAAKVFGSGIATWGNTSNPAHGNYLIDDEATDDIVLSQHVKGSFVTAMLFGHIRNRAEHITLSAVQAIVQARGGRRRRGR